MNQPQRKTGYQKPTGTQQAPVSTSHAKGSPAPYNLAFSVGDEMVRLTGLFQNKSKAGNDYLGAKKIRAADLTRLVDALSAAPEGTEIGVFVFENTGKKQA